MQPAPSYDKIVDSKFDDIVATIDLSEWERRMMLAVTKECVRVQTAAGPTTAEEIARFRRWMALEAKLEAKA
jgi:hypothetical protein